MMIRGRDITRAQSPNSAASLAVTSAVTAAGARPAILSWRARRSMDLTWSTRIAPPISRPSGSATLNKAVWRK